LAEDTAFFFSMGNSNFWPNNGSSVEPRETRIWLSGLASGLARVVAEDTSGHVSPNPATPYAGPDALVGEGRLTWNIRTAYRCIMCFSRTA
jgi:hypothetical protein